MYRFVASEITGRWIKASRDATGKLRCLSFLPAGLGRNSQGKNFPTVNPNPLVCSGLSPAELSYPGKSPKGSAIFCIAGSSDRRACARQQYFGPSPPVLSASARFR